MGVGEYVYTFSSVAAISTKIVSKSPILKSVRYRYEIVILLQSRTFCVWDKRKSLEKSLYVIYWLVGGPEYDL